MKFRYRDKGIGSIWPMRLKKMTFWRIRARILHFPIFCKILILNVLKCLKRIGMTNVNHFLWGRVHWGSKIGSRNIIFQFTMVLSLNCSPWPLLLLSWCSFRGVWSRSWGDCKWMSRIFITNENVHHNLNCFYCSNLVFKGTL